jgi:hypothetical protein
MDHVRAPVAHELPQRPRRADLRAGRARGPRQSEQLHGAGHAGTDVLGRLGAHAVCDRRLIAALGQPLGQRDDDLERAAPEGLHDL